jgi:hypothetical protein
MDITGGHHKEWTRYDYASAIFTHEFVPVTPSDADGQYLNVAPGDLFISVSNTDRVGVFIAWSAGSSVDEAYILTLYQMPGTKYGTVRIIKVKTSDYYVVRPKCFTQPPYRETERIQMMPRVNDLDENGEHWQEQWHKEYYNTN